MSRLPGTGKPKAIVSKMLGRSSTMWPVGPRKTENASTAGMMAATRATHSTVSKNPRNQNEISVRAASFEKSARMSRLATSHKTASDAECGSGEAEPLGPPEREHEPDDPEDRRDEHDPEEHDLPPEGHVRQRCRDRVVDREHRKKRHEPGASRRL